MAMSGTPHQTNRLTVPGAANAAIPLVTEPDVDRSASMGSLVKQATEHMSTLVRSEIELAKMEVTASVKSGVRGGIFFGLAAAIGVFSLFFFFFMIGEILAIWLPRSLAFAIVFIVMVLAAGALAFLGWRKVKQIKKPEQTIASLTETASTLKYAATHTPETATQGAVQPTTLPRR
ncbi:phage holin family protein [Nakamurella flavida]|uniref:Phage holin family protein n=2 Tax=Nakamurella flavida TaxID=363630 RepID=A0A939C277_9ACTN|nr:phage holin family protein [Nakamurella flavida]MDP9779637.1 putative membrane protein YqjE [Nakamurella flavida]